MPLHSNSSPPRTHFRTFPQALSALALIASASMPAASQPGPPIPPTTVAKIAISGLSACADLQPSVTALRGGGAFTVWQRSGCGAESEIWGRRYDPSARALGPGFRITRGSQPTIAELPDGSLALAYFDDPGLNQFAIFLRRLDESGRPLGPALAVSEPVAEGFPDTPRLAVSAHGDVALAWNLQIVGFVPFLRFEGDLHLPAVRFFDAALEPQTAVLRPAALQCKGNCQPDVAFSNTGAALVVWGGPLESAGFEEIVGRRYDLVEGWLDAEPRRVASTTTAGDALRAPRIAPKRGSGGGWWLAWISEGSSFEPRTQAFVGAVDGGFDLEPVRSIVALGDSVRQLTAPGLGTDIAGNALALTVNDVGEIRGVALRPNASASPRFTLSETGFDARDLALAQGTSSFFATWASATIENPQSDEAFDLLGRSLRIACGPNSTAACFDGSVLSPSVTVERTGAGGGTLTPLLVGPNTALFFRPNALVPEIAVQLGQTASGEFDLTYAATTSAGLRIRSYRSSGDLGAEITKPTGRFRSERIGNQLRRVDSEVDLPSPVESLKESEAPQVGTLEVCESTPTRLCLVGGRFLVEATYVDSTGVSRLARVAPHGERTGTLEFDGKPAMVVSLIDGTASNGKSWVYLGSLSRSQSTVVITEVASRRTRTYDNPAGKLQSRADRLAF